MTSQGRGKQVYLHTSVHSNESGWSDTQEHVMCECHECSTFIHTHSHWRFKVTLPSQENLEWVQNRLLFHQFFLSMSSTHMHVNTWYCTHTQKQNFQQTHPSALVKNAWVLASHLDGGKRVARQRRVGWGEVTSRRNVALKRLLKQLGGGWNEIRMVGERKP